MDKVWTRSYDKNGHKIYDGDIVIADNVMGESNVELVVAPLQWALFTPDRKGMTPMVEKETKVRVKKERDD